MKNFLISGRYVAWLALSLCGLAGVGFAQQGSPQDQQKSVGHEQSQVTTLHVTSQLVVLDVTVTDKKGALRANLTEADFQVTENGIPQKIVHFEAPAEHALPGGTDINSTADLERRAPQSPVTVIVLDEMNTRYEDMGYARYALEKYLNAQPQELSAPTTLLAAGGGGLQVLTDYTQDRGVILASLKKHLASYPWELQRNPNRVQQLVQSLGTLEQVAEATAGHPGHKTVLWVGHGFPGIELSGPNLDSNAADRIKAAVEQAVDMLRDSRITLYTIDPTAMSSAVIATEDDNSGPLGDIVDPATDPFLGSVNFIALAKATGGKSFFSRNDVDAEIGESARDGLNYYTLAYRPAVQSGEARAYRKIRVTFAQPGLQATLRDGYYTRDSARDTPAANRAVYDIDAAVENTIVYTGLDVHAVERPNVPGTYVVGIPESQLVWEDDAGEQSSRLTVVAAAIDAKGKVLRRITNALTARRLSDTNSAAGAKLVRTEISLPYVAGASRVRIVVRVDGNGRVGSADIRAKPVIPATRGNVR